ncbi:MAG: MGMT family protein [Dissulfurispiraceae bacterium]|nr:MGMT family protein [Dissulfurispiraceae bacterium]
MKNKISAALCHCVLETQFGQVAIVWSRHQGCVMIEGIVIPSPDLESSRILKQDYPDSQFSSCIEIDELAAQVFAYFSGEKIRFLLDNLRLDQCSLFQQQVLKACFKIPRGRISTYKNIAEQIGRPKAVRAVGTALAKNPFAIIIPCHRVVSSDLKTGGFYGGAGMKRALLELEGVEFDAFGRTCSDFLV